MTRRDLLKTIPAAPFAAGAMAAARTARMRTGLCAYTFREALASGKLSYQDLVDIAVENDVDGLDVTVYWFPEKNLGSFLSDLRRKAYLNAVEIPSIAIRSNLCRKTADEQRQEAAWLNHWVDVAEELGASHIRVFGGEVPQGETEDAAVGWVSDILARSAEYAASKGVILGIENHGGITLRAERILQIIGRVNHPFVKVNLDTANFRAHFYEQIEQLVPHAANTQFKLTMRYADGRIEPSDWDRIVKMLADGGYRGYLALELDADEEPFRDAPPALKRLRQLADKYSA